jgi:hypothetical protein
MIFEQNSWKNICSDVSKITNNIVPYIKRKSVLSGIISNIFETYSSEYFNKNNIETKSSSNDREPDLFFVKENLSCEIKVTGVGSDSIKKKVTWLGGRYSKRNSEHLFIMWNYNPENKNLYGIEKSYFSFFILKTTVAPEDWVELSNSNDYYGVGFHSDKFMNKKIDILVGKNNNGIFELEKFYV